MREIDASDVEHVSAMVTGGLLVAMGLTKNGIGGTLFKLGGIALLYRGSQGYRPLYDALHRPFPQAPSGVGRQNVRVESSVLVDRPVEELYRIWRNLENLPVFMDHLNSVTEIDDRRSHWVAKAPAGMVIKWDAEIINDVENQVIAWQTLEGSGVDNAGSVLFEPTDDGATRIRVVMRYDPPADMLGAFIGKLFHVDPQRQLDYDLMRFKRIMEAGPYGEPSRASSLQAQAL